jgi:hypothetical protein
VVDGAGQPIQSALVEVVGSDVAAKEAGSDGTARFSGLSGKIEVLVWVDGFASKTQTVNMNRSRSIEISV